MKMIMSLASPRMAGLLDGETWTGVTAEFAERIISDPGSVRLMCACAVHCHEGMFTPDQLWVDASSRFYVRPVCIRGAKQMRRNGVKRKKFLDAVRERKMICSKRLERR